ncbi:hypothetical protein AJ80_05718 [Polytolypa hystricis UAMH7299]|uniref:Aminodeoxychorismate lyase n=1 Tax=Polytolypa hystricis (strain UAMH7299) TaxID=1447883 RepID=A0A2B7Y185_POLH7|nr:hypothetical protein AJ80_05718 [Polytolypa hystricis UAMH7299]
MASPPNFQITTTIRYDPELSTNTSISIPASCPSPSRSPYYLLSYHRDRLLSAARDFQWDAAIAVLQQQQPNEDAPDAAAAARLANVLNKSIPDPAQPWKLRVLLNESGNFTVEATPTTPFPSHILLLPSNKSTSFSDLAREDDDTQQPWLLRIDTQPTHPSLFTTHKTTMRDEYTASRERAGISSPRDRIEVVIWNPAGEVMEGSITTVYFRRKRRRGQLSSSAVDEKEEMDGDEWVTPPLSCGGNAATSRRYALASGMCSEEVVRVEDLVDGEEVWVSNGVRGFMPAIFERGGEMGNS